MCSETLRGDGHRACLCDSNTRLGFARKANETASLERGVCDDSQRVRRVSEDRLLAPENERERGLPRHPFEKLGWRRNLGHCEKIHQTARDIRWVVKQGNQGRWLTQAERKESVYFRNSFQQIAILKNGAAFADKIEKRIRIRAPTQQRLH